jgi:hypothetical protein
MRRRRVRQDGLIVVLVADADDLRDHLETRPSMFSNAHILALAGSVRLGSPAIMYATRKSG